MVALAVAGPSALAQPAAAPDRRALEQKEALVRRLVLDSPAEQRIAASGNAEAKLQLERARALHARAKALADAGDLREADVELNAAMWAIGKARQLVPDTMARVVEQRVRYASLLRTVDTLAGSYERHLARSRGLPRGSAASDAILEAARARIEEGKSLANSEHVAEAAAALQKAERELMGGLSRVLGSSTLDYSQRFETQSEEYAWELERNRAYRDLVPLALEELKPRKEALALVDRYLASNAKHVSTAQDHAAAKRFGPAIDTLRTGTTYLQAALSAAGLVIPKDAGTD
jgi:hypothetical protein